MASRKGRTESIAPAGSDVVQATTMLRSQLRAYMDTVKAVNSTLKDANQIHTEIDVENKPIPLVKARLDRNYERIGELTTDELAKIDQMLETIEKIEKVTNTAAQTQQAATPASIDVSIAPSPKPSAPQQAGGPGTGQKRGTYNKRRKTDTGSAVPSPAASRATSPSTLTSSLPISPATATVPLPRVTKGPHQPPPIAPATSRMPSPAPSSSSSVAASSSGIVTSRKTTTQNRKAAMAGQLPLADGRQIAFRVPIKGGAVSDRKPEEWILARIVSCISGDKNRYTVEDVDYDPKNATPEQGKWNTTLKSIVPLPDPRHKAETYPPEDYPPGTQVMALYPQTTSFYRAFIQSGPTFETDKKRKDRVYKVKFDDDDGATQSVPVELVVEIP